MKLNKFIADAGITSRREAVKLIKDGQISVNGEVETTPGYEVQTNDSVTMNGKRLRVQEKLYLVMNKPNGYITSVEDERGRKTVIDLVTPHVKERVFPVGRLDRDTTGILLLTNDGELTLRLTHPRYNIEKVYVATLDRSLDSVDLARLRKGLKLDDGFMKVDYAGFIDGASSKVVTVTIHSGKNRVVKRLFEHLGYSVVQLHRSKFGPLVLHGIGKGKIRPLTDDELDMLMQAVKMDGESIIKNAIMKPLKTAFKKPRKENNTDKKRLPAIKPFKSEQTDWRKAEAEEIRHMQESFAAFEDAAKKQKRNNLTRKTDTSKEYNTYKRANTKDREEASSNRERHYKTSRFNQDDAPMKVNKRDYQSGTPKTTPWSRGRDEYRDQSSRSYSSNNHDDYKRPSTQKRNNNFEYEERSYKSSRFNRDDAAVKSERRDYQSAAQKQSHWSRTRDEYKDHSSRSYSSNNYDGYKRPSTQKRNNDSEYEERPYKSSRFNRDNAPLKSERRDYQSEGQKPSRWSNYKDEYEGNNSPRSYSQKRNQKFDREERQSTSSRFKQGERPARRNASNDQRSTRYSDDNTRTTSSTREKKSYKPTSNYKKRTSRSY